MTCTEITDAMAWAKKTAGNDIFPVTAYFTRHQGVISKTTDPADAGRDFCSYAVGNVKYVAPGPGIGLVEHLAGDLTVQYWNAASGSGMVKSPNVLRLQIFPDGTVIFQDILNGNPIPSPIKVTTTCVGGVVITGTYNTGVVAVGVRRDPEDQGPK
jgi:hypothetical protein